MAAVLATCVARWVLLASDTLRHLASYFGTLVHTAGWSGTVRKLLHI